MGRLLLITLFLSDFFVKGQPSCSSTGTVGDTFYPNTVSTPTYATNGVQFLCGPNTIVYDTISLGCLFVHVNTGSTLFYNKGCPQLNVNNVWLKNNSTINILANCPPMSLTVYYEPLATINNPAAVQIGSVACASIIFPAIDCSVGINELNNQESFFAVYPNPSSSSISIEVVNLRSKTADLSIFNQLGELVLRRKDWRVSEKEINIDGFSSGLYFIQVKTSQGQQTQKLVINR
jgi:hypothetical protein